MYPPYRRVHLLYRVSFREKLPKRLQILLRSNGIAQSMSGTGNGNQFLSGNTGFVVFMTHITRNKVISFAVKEDHRNGAMPHSCNRGGTVEIKVAEDACA